MEDLMAQQKVAIHAIDRALDNFKKIGKTNYTLGVVRNRLLQLKENYARFELLHGKILAAATKEFIATSRYFTEDRFDKCEETFLTTSDYMAEWMSRLESPPQVNPGSSPVSQCNISASPRTAFQLPRINLPKFAGEFREWEAFRDQFTALIINNRDLLEVNRLQYLHSCVKGEASDAIRNLALTDTNFKIAWNLLLARYDNHRRLVHEHIHALHTLPPATSDSAAALTALRDKASVSIQSLKNLGRAVDTWDDMLAYLLVQRLDKGTRNAWELKLGDTLDYPTYEQLDNFLKSRIRALENILPASPQVKGNKQHSSVQAHAANACANKCPMCQKTHFLSACPDF
ncbi:uncharacterized protein LOC112459388 [Temnothorax curvispinosus]|uniref:Uncharacterized protein LOC112459388 n=1 Tax=Temnothorax curvispinosus TaxID=300111 RepID=A0A6J1QA77_9HYME|nr:uncharacterized protein LOC112459388 [Temnothorax curvispinosus]